MKIKVEMFDIDKLYVMLPEFNKKKGKFEKIKYDDSKSSEKNTREQRNNRMLDMMYSVLTNEDTSDKIFNPGGFDELKKTSRIIELAKVSGKEKNSGAKFKYNELNRNTLKTLTNLVLEKSTQTQLNVLSPSTQFYFHAQNTIAKKLIGAVANHNTSHAVMQDNPVSLIMKNPITLNGVTIDSNTVLDKEFAFDGITYISKNTGSMVASSVDAIKDPVLNTLNINPFTINTASMLLRYGFDFDTIGLFLAQPIIIDLTREYFKLNSDGFVVGDKVISDFIDKKSKKLNGVNIKNKIETIKNNKFLKNELFDSLGVIPENQDFNWNEFQFDVLIAFSELYKKGKDVNELTFMTKFDTTNSVPGGISDFMMTQLRINKFYSSFDNKFIMVDNDRQFLDGSFVKSFMEYTSNAFNEIFSRNFPYFNEEYTDVLDVINKLTDNNLNAKLINNIFLDYNYFKLSQLQSFNGDIDNRKYYFYEFPMKVKEELLDNPELSNNDLIKVIKLIAPNNENKLPFYTLNLKSGGSNIDIKQKIKNGWNELLENPKYKKLAIDLFAYNLYRNGFEFSPITFLNMAPIELREGIEGYIDFLRPESEIGLFSNYGKDVESKKYIRNSFVNQFIRNNSNDKRLVSQFDVSELDIVMSSENKLVLDFGEEEGPQYLKITEKNEKGKIQSYLYMKGNQYDYYPISQLGFNNQAKEYDFYEWGNLESSINKNKASSINFRKKTASFNTESIKTPNEVIEKHGINIDQIDSIISSKFNVSKEQLKQLEGEKINSKMNEFIKANYTNFENMSNKEQEAIIKYFNESLIDDKGEKIC